MVANFTVSLKDTDNFLYNLRRNCFNESQFLSLSMEVLKKSGDGPWVSRDDVTRYFLPSLLESVRYWVIRVAYG